MLGKLVFFQDLPIGNSDKRRLAMKNTKNQAQTKNPGIDRRGFLTATGAALAAGMMPFKGFSQQAKPAPRPDPLSIKSNVHVALCQPKTRWSMPGLYPGVVAEVHQPGAMNGLQPVPGAAKGMLAAGLKTLTGEKDPRDAWRCFVTPGERIGIKFNPVGHKISGVTWDVIGAVVDGLESAGIPRKDMLVWHRFNDEHAQTYIAEKVHPGVEAYLLNWFIVKDGKNTPGGFERWDESVFYEAEVSLPDEQNYLEEMFHGGTKSLFPRILTHAGSAGGVDKVINIPSFKHHGGPFITMALKNLAFGSITNCPARPFIRRTLHLRNMRIPAVAGQGGAEHHGWLARSIRPRPGPGAAIRLAPGKALYCIRPGGHGQHRF